MKPLISFIIPIYNAGETISRCVNSILAMERSDVECILIDDGSTDNSLDVCQAEFGDDDRVKIHTQKNSGVSTVRNRGIQMADGQFIMFVDSDDYVDGDALLRCMKKLDSDNKIIIFNYARIKKGQTILESMPQTTAEHKILSQKSMEQLFCSHILHNIGTKIYPKKLLMDNHIQFECDIAVYEDILFALRAIRNAKETLVYDEVVYYYDIRQNSLNHSYRKNYFEAVRLLDGELLTYGYDSRFVAEVYLNHCIRAIMNEMKIHEKTKQRRIIREISTDKRLKACLQDTDFKGIKLYYKPILKFMQYSMIEMAYLYCRLLAKFEK